MIANLFFYLFSAILLASAVMVISSRNPVHSVLFLILGFVNAAALFLLAGAEFLAAVLVIVYVGAVAVLFLFVVMMLDVNFAALREGVQRYAPVGLAVGAVLLVELVLIAGGWHVAAGTAAARLSPMPAGLSNTAALGVLLYTKYIFLFQLAGAILLVSMIGAIVLTLRPRRVGKRQNLAAQHARTPDDTLSMVRASIGKGVKVPARRREDA